MNRIKNHWDINMKDINIVKVHVSKKGFKKLIKMMKKDSANILKIEAELKEGKYVEVY